MGIKYDTVGMLVAESVHLRKHAKLPLAPMTALVVDAFATIVYRNPKFRGPFHQMISQ